MNENQEMLLIDTPPGSPRRSREQVEEEDLLLDLNYQDYSTSDNTLTFTPQPPKLQGETWSSTIHWNQSTFFCEEDSEEDQNEYSIITDSNLKEEFVENCTQKVSSRYGSLISQLERALQLIEVKQKLKPFTLYASAEHVKSENYYQKANSRPLKTQRDNKEEVQESDPRRNKWKHYSKMRKSVTEPDDSPFTASRTKPKASRHQGSSIYYVGRVIKEVDEKESPRIKKSERQRTKEEFLVSVKNWQERKKLKQEQRILKEQALTMNGVTFTPQINAKSKLLVKKKGIFLPIYERGPVKQKKITLEPIKTSGKPKK